MYIYMYIIYPFVATKIIITLYIYIYILYTPYFISDLESGPKNAGLGVWPPK